MLDTIYKNTTNTWKNISEYLSVPHTEKDYIKMTKYLDELIDETKGDEKHELTKLIETIGTLLEKYDILFFQAI